MEFTGGCGQSLVLSTIRGNAPVRNLRHLSAETVDQGGKDQGLVGAAEGMEAALGLSGTTGLAQHTSTPWILESQCWEGPRGCDQLSLVSKG